MLNVLCRVDVGGCVLAAAVAPLWVSGAAFGQWSATNLHPAGALESQALGVGRGQQVGYARIGPTVGHTRASLWTGSAGSWVNLQPPAATGVVYSTAYGVDEGMQVGEAVINGGSTSHASQWAGTAGSWVDVHPAAASQSILRGVKGGVSVGVANVFWARAGLWSSPSSSSWVDLSPPDGFGDTSTAEAFAVSGGGGQQVGFAIVNSVIRASLWTGAAGSWVDLHPAGNISSWAYGIDGGEQVGVVRVPNSTSHAALWRGSAGTWVDLHPAGATNSRASDVFRGWQVGYADLPSGRHASVWQGTAASRVDLHDVLPPSFIMSEATAIWGDSTSTVVVGWGYNSATQRGEALMWTGPAVCRADFSGDGTVNSADFFDFLTAFFAGSFSADFNGDGVLNSADFFDFLGAFFVGC